MDAISKIPALIAIAQRAIEADAAEIAAKSEAADLHEAYTGHKRRNGIDHVERDTPEWEAMMRATSGEFASVEAAKRQARNAKRRLKSAIAKYHRAGEVSHNG